MRSTRLLNIIESSDSMLIKRVALVTGGSKGLGKAIVKKLYDEGYNVAFTYFNSEDEAVQICEGKDDNIFAIKSDASSFTEAFNVIEKVINKFSKIDVIINNAAAAKDNPIWKISEKDWDFTMEHVLKPSFNYAKAVVEHFIENKYGKVINIGSINGLRGREGSIAYSTAKAALVGFTKTLAKELGKYNINVNLVAPGYIETEGQSNTSELIKKMVLDECYIKVLTAPEEVANLVYFLASEYSNNITGQIYKIDCGQYI